jgi:hypothetical protein
MSHLAGLSVETLEQIFLPLHGQDIVRVGTVRPTPCDTVLILRGTGQVSRDFTDLFHSLSILQHRRELFAAGVVCNPCSSCDPTKSRGLRRECTCKQEHPCDAFCLHSNDLSFLHIPPPSSRKTVSGVSPYQLPSSQDLTSHHILVRKLPRCCSLHAGRESVAVALSSFQGSRIGICFPTSSIPRTVPSLQSPSQRHRAGNPTGIEKVRVLESFHSHVWRYCGELIRARKRLGVSCIGLEKRSSVWMMQFESSRTFHSPHHLSAIEESGLIGL